MSIISAIPWSAILKQAPILVKAADALLSGTLIKRKGNAANTVESLRHRVESLEIHDRQDAELMKKMAEELQALTVNTRILAARLKIILWIAIVGFACGAGAFLWIFRFRQI